MGKNGNELNQEEMKKATGGDFLPAEAFVEPISSHITQTAHCRACHKAAIAFGGKYRCQTPGCSECGKDKSPAEVDWY